MGKYFELVPGNQDRAISFQFSFILLPIKANLISKKKSCKRDLICPNDSSSGKVVLKLLTEGIILHIRLTVIDIRELGLGHTTG